MTGILQLLAGFLLAAAVQEDSRNPVPPAETRDSLAERLRELHRESYSRRDPATRRALVDRLLADALQTSAPDDRFVLLASARDLAAEIGDLERASRAIALLVAGYALPPAGSEGSATSMKLEMLGVARKAPGKTREGRAALAEAFLAVAHEGLEAEDYGPARDAATAAVMAGRIAGLRDLANEAKVLAAEIADLREAALEARAAELPLSINPDDPDANLVVGRYECFVKGNWDLGLRMLGKGADPLLRTAARRDLADPEGVRDRAGVGDAWWEAARAEKDAKARAAMLHRAREHFETALADLSGIARIELEKEVEKLDAEIARTSGAPKERIVLDLGGRVKLDLVLIRAGTFVMGGTVDANPNSSWQGIEKPKHKVSLTRPFYMGRTEVTQAQYEALMGENPSRFKGPDLPVEMVTWTRAVEFCRRASRKTRKRVRLPTEAEWEYACRAGSQDPHGFGKDASLLGQYAWHKDNAGGRTHPVGGKKPNAWGLHDMHGNVWEWVADWYAADYYAKSPARNPKGPATGNRRLLRGGSWYYDVGFRCRSAFRHHNDPERGYPTLGFRIVVDPSP